MPTDRSAGGVRTPGARLGTRHHVANPPAPDASKLPPTAWHHATQCQRISVK